MPEWRGRSPSTNRARLEGVLPNLVLNHVLAWLGNHVSRQHASLGNTVKRFRGGLVFKAHRLLYRSTLGLRVIKKKKKKQHARLGNTVKWFRGGLVFKPRRARI